MMPIIFYAITAKESYADLNSVAGKQQSILNFEREPFIEALIDVEGADTEKSEGRDNREADKGGHEFGLEPWSQNATSSFEKDLAHVLEDQPKQPDQNDDVEVDQSKKENGVNKGKRGRNAAQSEFNGGQ